MVLTNLAQLTIMVTNNNKTETRRNRSEHSIEAIHRLARQGQVAYGSQRVQDHIINYLGYSLKEVCDCLLGISEMDYKESIDYGDHKKWLDVYISSISPPGKPKNDPPLYIKLKLNRDCTTLVLASFHPEGML